MQRRSFLIKLVVLGVAAVIGGGCGPGIATDNAAKPAASGGDTIATQPVPDVQSGSLVSPFTYDSGTVAFDAPPASFTPSVSASDAVNNFLATGVYSGIENEGTPEVFLAAYSSWGKDESATDLPVWVVRYTNIPDSPGGGGGAGGSDREGSSTTPDVVLHDVVAIVDASTGQCLAVIGSLPDATPQPPPPDVAPGAAGKTDATQSTTP